MAWSPLGRGRISQEVLGLLLGMPGQELHTREIARRVHADAHPVQRALEQQLGAGLVQSRRLGNLRLWSAAQDSALAPALRELLRQTTGVAERLRRTLAEMPSVQLALLFGSYASGRDQLGSDIDLCIVGTVKWRQFSQALAAAASELGREVNPVVWTLDELMRPTPEQARFIRDVLSTPRIWLVGDDNELERIRSSMGAPVVGGSARQARPVRRRGGAVARSTGRAQRPTRKA